MTNDVEPEALSQFRWPSPGGHRVPSAAPTNLGRVGFRSREDMATPQPFVATVPVDQPPVTSTALDRLGARVRELDALSARLLQVCGDLELRLRRIESRFSQPVMRPVPTDDPPSAA